MKGWRTTYRVVLEAAEDGGGAPPAVRLRALLKTGWRRDRLKCTRAEQLGIVDGWGPVDDSLPLQDEAGI